MNRQDWVFVGVRLLGVFFLARGVVAFPTIFQLDPGVKSETAAFLEPILLIVVGLVLAAFAGPIGGWRDRSVAR